MGAGGSTSNNLDAAAAKVAGMEAGIEFDQAEFDKIAVDGKITRQMAVQYKLHAALRATGSKFTCPGDKKDEAGMFQYIKFEECPKFGDNAKSAMAKVVPEVYEELKDVTTAGGYTFSNAIQTGCLLPHLGVGCTAGDEESWDKFKALYYPVIKAWHGYDPETQSHPTNLDSTLLEFSDEQKAKFEKYVASTRIRAARNFAGYSLPCGSSDDDRAGVEKVVSEALTSITDEDLKGTYYPLAGMTDENRDALLAKGYLFQIPTDRNLLMGAGAARNWPHGRGIFHNDKQTALAWCNEEDHCRIISMKMGGDIPDVFKRFGDLSNALAATGAKFMMSEKLGYLGTCPSNLGTGLRASVMVQLKKFNELLENPESSHGDKELLETVCSMFDLQPRGSAGEHSPAKDAKFDVSNKQRLGFSEVVLVHKMIAGVTKVIEYEEMLVAGSTPADIRAKAEADKPAVAADIERFLAKSQEAPAKAAQEDGGTDVSAGAATDERFYVPSQRTYAKLLLRPNGTFAYVINCKANVKSLTDGDAPGDMRIRGTYLEHGNVCTLNPVPPSTFRAEHPEITIYEPEGPDDEGFKDEGNSERSSFKVVLGDQPAREGQVPLKMDLPAEAKDSWMDPDYEE